jgi:hypothetical protein
MKALSQKEAMKKTSFSGRLKEKAPSGKPEGALGPFTNP